MYRTKGIVVSLTELQTMLRRRGLSDMADEIDFRTNDSGELECCFDNDDYLQKWEAFDAAFHDEYGFAPLNQELVSLNDELIHFYHCVKEETEPCT